jgi:hypothetical protein
MVLWVGVLFASMMLKLKSILKWKKFLETLLREIQLPEEAVAFFSGPAKLRLCLRFCARLVMKENGIRDVFPARQDTTRIRVALRDVCNVRKAPSRRQLQHHLAQIVMWAPFPQLAAQTHRSLAPCAQTEIHLRYQWEARP